MPVRMTRDDDSSDNNSSGGNDNRNNGLGILAILGFVFFFFKYPKFTLAVAAIAGGLWYFGFFDKYIKKYFGGSGNSNSSVSTGCNMKQEVFDQAEVFEPLAADRNSLPSQVNLDKYCPPALSQGQQGSCVGWSSAYNARTVLYCASTGANPQTIHFSPSFLYNQIRLEGCQGAYIREAMETMIEVGALPLGEFAYDESSCDKDPSSDEKNRAAQYKMAGYNRLTLNHNNYKIDLLAIKQNLAQGAPVVIGMYVGGSFYDMYGSERWEPSSSDRSNKEDFGGHAMCVIGYDDNKFGGAFLVANSWGSDWGKNGRFWMSYDDFEEFTNEAYGLYPMPSKEVNDLKLAIGLLENDSKRYIALNQEQSIAFETSDRLAVGTRFKMEVVNETPCYTYVFGQETDGSSYVLFPYTEKHSAFCGIVGARLFPKDYSMELDNVGNKDHIAVLVSKEELDFKALNDKISRQSGKDYAQKIKSALGSRLYSNPSFVDGENIQIQADNIGNQVVAFVVGINK